MPRFITTHTTTIMMPKRKPVAERKIYYNKQKEVEKETLMRDMTKRFINRNKICSATINCMLCCQRNLRNILEKKAEEEDEKAHTHMPHSQGSHCMLQKLEDIHDNCCLKNLGH